MDKRNDEVQPTPPSKAEGIKALKDKLWTGVGCTNKEEADAVIRYATTDDRNGAPLFQGLADVEKNGVGGVVVAEINRCLQECKPEELLALAKDAAR